MNGESADRACWAGRLAAGADGDRGWIDGPKAKTVGGDDAVVQDVVDVGLSSEAAESSGIVVVSCGLDCCDAEMLVAPGEAGTGGGDAGLCVSGDGGVAIEDEVTMGGDAGGVDLGTGGSRSHCQEDS